ncbi:MAG: hypothetical protein ABSA71_05635 [Desulfomonilia bacterium]
MKRFVATMTTILTIGILLSGMAYALGQPQGPPPEGSSMSPFPHQGPHESFLPCGLVFLARCQEINVIAELTGLTQENVKQLLISSPPAAILDAYGVPFETYVQAMDKQTTKLVKQASAAGIITKKQEEEILKRMTQKLLRPGHMKKELQ